ncbi:multidrug effflux MFS transporter [Campylobacter curvus]|uniref:Drug resistance transporter, Bcr/CflA family n=1 Tax=Campylobacter curvus (strain 525.92) TaxID=360105 RepID=A7GX73_CAMC5|nr:multidrug effflux MFS transporter [Campylobacter curvus]EAU00034.1 drug resistance transporter, Bcr/CflA family [Campylobacter curvus 525.92]
MRKKHNSRLFLLLFLGALSAFGPFVTDLYLPALPSITTWFDTSVSATQLTLSTSMAGLAIGQLIIGPISDKFGRKRPLTISLIIYTISTICIFFAQSIEIFIFMRVIQGLASAGSLVISRAVVSDLYSGHEMTKFFGLMMVINGIAPIISPIGGSFLLEFTDWRGIFVVLSIIGVLLFVANFNFKESLDEPRRIKAPLLETYGVYKQILINKTFMLFVAIQTCALGTMFAYIACSSFIFQDFYGLSSMSYSVCFASNGLALVIGSRTASLLKDKMALRIGVYGIFASSIVVGLILTAKFHVYAVIVAFFIMLLFIGFILPTASSLAMNSARRYAGSASAVLGFCPFFLGGIVSPLVGLGDIFYSSSLTMLVCTLLALTAFFKVMRGGHLQNG